MIQNLWVACFIFLMSFLSYYFKKLSFYGAVCGGILAASIYIGAGFTGLLSLGFFFLVASLATSWKISMKIQRGWAEKKRGRRNFQQVLANGGVAGLCGIFSYLYPEETLLFQLMLIGSLSAAISDTLSSELGVIYGKYQYNILTGKKGIRGANGVISLEGLVAGIFGSLIMAAIFTLMNGNGNHFYWIIIAGLFGNLIDSLLGATMENRGIISNDVVNVINTLSGAIMMSVMYFLFR